MSFDGLMMYHLIKEYQLHLIPSKLENIYFEQPDRFIFHSYHGSKYQIIIDLNAQGNRIYFEDEQMKPKTSHPFLNTLKKHLTKASIQNLRQHQTDRVLLIDFTSYDPFDGKQDYILIFEAMGKHANLILTKDNIIIGAYKTIISTNHRSIYQGLEYQFFPSHKVPFTNMERPHDDAKLIQQTYEGISPDTALYLALTYQKALDIIPVPTLYQNHMLLYHKTDGKTYPSINDLMREDISKPLSLVQELQIIEKAIDKKQQKLGFLSNDLISYEDKLDLKTKADTLLTYPHQYDYVNHVFDTPLDPTKTVNENIQDMYKTYKKAHRALENIQAQIDMTQAEIDILKQAQYDIKEGTIQYDDLKQLMVELELIKPQKKTSKPTKTMYKTIHHEDYVIFYGINALQNNYVTHQLAKHDDYFMHVKDAPGAHVIYRGSDQHEGFQIALKVAAYHSKLKYSSSIPVNVTFKKHVKKIAGLHGSYVSFKTYQTKYVDIDDDFVNMWDIM